METIAQQLGRVAFQITQDGLSIELRREASRRILDVIGNSIAATNQPATQVVNNIVKSWAGPADSFAIGAGKLPASAAALLNGTLALMTLICHQFYIPVHQLFPLHLLLAQNLVQNQQRF